MHINGNMLCANEFALAIALTVFIILSVILAVLLISLAVSKNFRTVFFREKQRKKKQTKKPALSEPAPSEPQAVDTIPIDPPKARRTPTRKSAENDGTPEFLNAIPTVPLGGFPQGPAPTRGGRARQSMRVAEIPDETEQGGTYVTRSVTITRARSTRPTDGESDKEQTAQSPRRPKRDNK